MEENKQFDNNGVQISPPTPPSPPPRYRHESERACQPREGARACRHEEDAFVIRIKWRHIKLAALLSAAFIFGSCTTAIKYARVNRVYPTVSKRAYSTNMPQAVMPGSNYGENSSSAYYYGNGSSYKIEIEPEAKVYYSVPEQSYNSYGGRSTQNEAKSIYDMEWHTLFE